MHYFIAGAKKKAPVLIVYTMLVGLLLLATDFTEGFTAHVWVTFPTETMKLNTLKSASIARTAYKNSRTRSISCR